mmetsp:Transcript_1556/g.3111  ORF Transcript_1556/g.3111 Transcript_1556/m.3111 type:complete len:139 (+) Transcript_1556:206-622(+)
MGSTSELALVACVLKPLKLGPESSIRGVGISLPTDLSSTTRLSQICWVHKGGCVKYGEGVRDVLRVEVAIKQPRGVGIESSEASLWSLDVSTQRVNAYPGKPAASRVGEGSGVRHPRFKLGNLRSVLHQNTRVAMMPS